MRFKCDNRSWAYRHAAQWRALAIHGVVLGEPYGYVFGDHWNRRISVKARLRDLLFNRVRLSAFRIDDSSVKTAFRGFARRRVTHFVGYPSAITDFCLLGSDAGLPLRDLKLKCVLTTAEPLREHQREIIERVLGTRCVNMYGSVEGGVGAFEGVEGYLHQSVETSLILIEDGELLVTDLHSLKCPLIKYRVGDTAGAPPRASGLRLAHPLIGAIEGRSGDRIELGNGRVLNPNLPSYVFKPLAAREWVRKFRMVYGRAESSLRVLVVPHRGWTPEAEAEILEEVRKGLQMDRVTLEVVDDLPQLPNAKHRDFIVVPTLKHSSWRERAAK